MKSPEKIRFLIMGNMAPYAIGGVEVKTWRLARYFASQGHQVTVIGHANSNASMDKGRNRGSIASVRLPTIRWNRLTRALSFLFSMTFYLWRHRHQFDILLTLIIGESSLVAAGMKRAGVVHQPLIVGSACAGSTGDAARLNRLPGTPLLVRLLNRTCDAILILSPTIENELIEMGMDRRLFAPVVNGVPFAPQRKDRRGARSLPRFVFVGRLRPEKAVDNLLRAVHRLACGECRPQVHLVGDGPQRRRLEFLTRELGLERQVVFHGLIPHDQVRSFFEKDTVFVLPSINEGQPNALLEAMAAGCPAVVTRSGGSEFLVDEDRGVVVPPADSRALASAMQSMIEAGPERRAAMGAAARTFVRRHFSESSAGDRYLNLFKQLLQGNPSG